MQGERNGAIKAQEVTGFTGRGRVAGLLTPARDFSQGTDRAVD